MTAHTAMSGDKHRHAGAEATVPVAARGPELEPEPPVAGGGPLATRRAMLVGAGAAAVAVLGACTTYDQTAPSGNGGGGGAGADTPTGGAQGGGGSTETGAATSKPLVTTADVPVGGGVVLEKSRVVVTQPKDGTFKAFTAVCTHQGCLVSEVKGGTINCPCHSSQFKVADGTVASGPAGRPLRPVDIVVEGSNIRLA